MLSPKLKSGRHYKNYDDAVTETEIGKALQELRLKLREKYGADIIVI